MKYEVVIGIETHVQLATKSKLFCGCDNDAREAEPNTKVCPVCFGMPGTLPVLNAQAVKLALMAGLALNGKMGGHVKFDRKNYFYPDLPKGYQITQMDEPIIGKGHIEVPLEGETFTVGITRAHMEEDAGKLTHPEGADYSLVDLNRAGTPLLEIVSEPDIRSPQQAKAYAQEVYNLMRYAGVSDVNLYYGNMRFDVNISLRPEGATELGTRAEVKNLNSFRAVERAAEYEVRRQAELLDKGEKIAQETRGWDDDKQKTFSQRSKEDAMDYRYFPEPDVPPIIVDEKMLAEAKKGLPELPGVIRERLQQAGIPTKEIEALIGQPEVVLFWSAVAAKDGGKYAKYAANWLLGEELRLRESEEGEFKLGVDRLIAVAEMVASGELSSTAAKTILARIRSSNEDPQAVASELNLIQKSDAGEIEKWVDEALAASPDSVANYKAGKQQALGFLVGSVMKASRGQANPALVSELLRKKLGS
jgi:aspartyl-tRNA(Asn)/glutamyl-tRNA(Gln) amidotransferase subunit B